MHGELIWPVLCSGDGGLGCEPWVSGMLYPLGRIGDTTDLSSGLTILQGVELLPSHSPLSLFT